MKNILMIACAAVCAILVSGNTAHAIGGGGGGGKVARSAKVVMTNTEPVAGGISIAAWVRPVNTPLPRTLGALRSQLIFMGPGETRSTNNLRNGNYSITTVDVANLMAPDNTPLDAATVGAVTIDSENFAINGVDRTANLSRNGITFRN